MSQAAPSRWISQDAAVPCPNGAEQSWRDAAARALRAPAGRIAVAVTLSEAAPGAVRPHHRRILRAVLEEAAARHDGQVFAPGGADLLLICSEVAPALEPDADRRCALERLGELLGRLLGSILGLAAPSLLRLWRLETAAAGFEAYIAAAGSAEAQGRRDPEPALPGAPLASAEWLARCARTIDQAPLAELLAQQRAVLITPGPRDAPLETRIHPLYHEVGLNHEVGLTAAATGASLAEPMPSAAPTTARHAPGSADPLLVTYLVARLTNRLLDGIAAGAGFDPPAAAGGGAVPLHLALNPRAILSETFTRAASAAVSRRQPLGVEMTLAEACADLDLFAAARDRLAAAGVSLVLGGLDAAKLALADPVALAPTLIKLDWSPALADPASVESTVIGRLLARTESDHLVLNRADGEAALRWGQTHGIRRFQGRFPDAVLQAARLGLSIPNAAASTAPAAAVRPAPLAAEPSRGSGRASEHLPPGACEPRRAGPS